LTAIEVISGRTEWAVECGDCLALLSALPDGCADALVTDPPYGIGFQYRGGREAANGPAAYWEWLRPRYHEALRCVRPGGFVAVWQSGPYLRHLWEWFGDGIHVYAACKNFVQIRPTPINWGWDPVVTFYKEGADPVRAQDWHRTIDFHVANTADMGAREASRGHPCPRPLDQARELVINFVVEGGLVLDPFAGSGTTGVACLRTGRRFVGFDVEPAYCYLARRRLGAAPPLWAHAGAAGPGLFDPPPAEVTP
jgi:DNA modification methylase